MFGRRPNSNQARICVLWFSANRVWLVSHFFDISIYFYIIILHFNLINIQAGWIAYITCRPAAVPDR